MWGEKEQIKCESEATWQLSNEGRRHLISRGFSFVEEVDWEFKLLIAGDTILSAPCLLTYKHTTLLMKRPIAYHGLAPLAGSVFACIRAEDTNLVFYNGLCAEKGDQVYFNSNIVLITF